MVWKTKNGDFTLREPRLAAFARTFPSNGEPPHMIVEENKTLFLGLDLFFVKVITILTALSINSKMCTGLRVYVHSTELSTSSWHRDVR